MSGSKETSFGELATGSLELTNLVASPTIALQIDNHVVARICASWSDEKSFVSFDTASNRVPVHFGASASQRFGKSKPFGLAWIKKSGKPRTVSIQELTKYNTAEIEMPPIVFQVEIDWEEIIRVLVVRAKSLTVVERLTIRNRPVTHTWIQFEGLAWQGTRITFNRSKPEHYTWDTGDIVVQNANLEYFVTRRMSSHTLVL